MGHECAFHDRHHCLLPAVCAAVAAPVEAVRFYHANGLPDAPFRVSRDQHHRNAGDGRGAVELSARPVDGHGPGVGGVDPSAARDRLLLRRHRAGVDHGDLRNLGGLARRRVDRCHPGRAAAHRIRRAGRGVVRSLWFPGDHHREPAGDRVDAVEGHAARPATLRRVAQLYPAGGPGRGAVSPGDSADLCGPLGARPAAQPGRDGVPAADDGADRRARRGHGAGASPGAGRAGIGSRPDPCPERNPARLNPRVLAGRDPVRRGPGRGDVHGGLGPALDLFHGDERSLRRLHRPCGIGGASDAARQDRVVGAAGIPGGVGAGVA